MVRMRVARLRLRWLPDIFLNKLAIYYNCTGRSFLYVFEVVVLLQLVAVNTHVVTLRVAELLAFSIQPLVVIFLDGAFIGLLWRWLRFLQWLVLFSFGSRSRLFGC
jgi:uncharacterized membrane protein SpoIIM required for sporulation